MIRWCAPLMMAVLWPAAAGAGGWADEITASPFVFRSEFPLRDVNTLVSDLGELRDDIQTQLGLTGSDRTIQIHLFRTRSSYQRYLAVRVPEGVKRQALYMPGTDAGRVYAYLHRDIETDVRHESTHALLRNSLPYVPLWLDEGLAEYYEAPRPLRASGHPHLRSLRLAAVAGWRPDLERLEAKREFLEMGAKDYRDAWALVHFMLHGPAPAREELLAFFAEIESGAAPTPLSTRLGRRFSDLEARVAQHIRSVQ